MYKLVIVDDETEIRDGLCNYFPWDQLGFKVTAQFENGLQALEYLQHETIDVLLCDIKMPFMNGLELAKELKVRNSRVKILLLSGYREFDYAREAMEYGVRDYIVKPTKYDELIKVFSKIKMELDKETVNIDSAIDKATESSNYNEKIITMIKGYLQDNFQNATLEEAANLVHMNPFYLSKFFKDKTKENFSDYLITVRMEKAAQLLKDIVYKTYEISEKVGYSNPKNFTRTFKKYYGKTPKEFRNSP
ncbi:MAG TPA: DNA-binding response regulator [Firmicutes bacterium]|nr:DNA-binding response regulator [Bacillota bacterium]